MARVTEHGFLKLNLNRIWAGQAYPGLKKWNALLELLGFYTDAVIAQGFVKGRTIVSDSVQIACHYHTFKYLSSIRTSFWPGNNILLALLKNKEAINLAECISKETKHIQKSYILIANIKELRLHKTNIHKSAYLAKDFRLLQELNNKFQSDIDFDVYLNKHYSTITAINMQETYHEIFKKINETTIIYQDRSELLSYIDNTDYDFLILDKEHYWIADASTTQQKIIFIDMLT